jgi:hypothetical protein
VLADPSAFELFEQCGARVAGDDLCTGSRQIAAVEVDDPDRALQKLARGLLDRPLCARTLPAEPDTVGAYGAALIARERATRGLAASASA